MRNTNPTFGGCTEADYNSMNIQRSIRVNMNIYKMLILIIIIYKTNVRNDRLIF